MRLVVSLSVHESPLSVIDQCNNLVHVAEADYVVIHVNARSSLTYSYLKGNMPNELKGKVFLSNERYDTGKESFCLHKAHCSNYKFIEENQLNYDYFLLEASNSLFVKFGVKEFIGKYDYGVGNGKLQGYWEDKVLGHKSLIDFIGEKEIKWQYFKGCHEGAYFRREILADFFSFIEELDVFCEKNGDLPTYPTEEVWFQLACQYLFKNSYQFSNTITYLPWHKGLEWTLQEIKLLIANELELPSGKFSIKRIERDENNLLRKFVANAYGY